MCVCVLLALARVEKALSLSLSLSLSQPLMCLPGTDRSASRSPELQPNQQRSLVEKKVFSSSVLEPSNAREQTERSWVSRHQTKHETGKKLINFIFVCASLGVHHGHGAREESRFRQQKDVHRGCHAVVYWDRDSRTRKAERTKRRRTAPFSHAHTLTVG